MCDSQVNLLLNCIKFFYRLKNEDSGEDENGDKSKEKQVMVSHCIYFSPVNILCR